MKVFLQYDKITIIQKKSGDDNMTIGERMREQRIKLDIKPKDIADKIGKWLEQKGKKKFTFLISTNKNWHFC